MTLGEGLRAQGITLEAEGDRFRLRGPANQITPDLHAELAAPKAEILAQLNVEVAGTLEDHICYARSEAELDRLVEEIQAGFEAGHLSQAKRLATLAMDTARQLARGLVNIPAAAFLGAS